LAIETVLTLRLVYHLPLRQTERFVTSIFDLMGLSVFGEGQWAAAKHGKRGFQGWKKLHLGVDDKGGIVVEAFTGPNVDDAKTGVEIIKKARFKVKTLVGDAAYDSREIYEAAKECGAPRLQARRRCVSLNLWNSAQIGLASRGSLQASWRDSLRSLCFAPRRTEKRVG
jgi:hypothetical protein